MVGLRISISTGLVFACLSAAKLGGAAPAQNFSAPAGPEILARLKAEHPRLLLTGAEFQELKERVASDARLKDWDGKIQKEAEALLGQPPSKYEIPDGLRLLATSRRVVDRIYTLGLMYRLHGDKRLVERAWAELEAAANFPDWNPRHFLDTAEMTHAFGIGYDWLYDNWTEAQRATLRKAMVEKGLRPAQAVYQRGSGFARARHNWNQVCNGGIGIGALAVAEAEPELAGEILHSALQSIPLAMVEFGPDGAWKEGPGYWHYATRYNIAFLAALDSALGTDFGLSRIPGFSETGLFPMYISGPQGRTFNYADGGDHAFAAPQLFWLARKFNQPACAWFERQAAHPEPQDLLWFDPQARANGPRAAGLPTAKWFRGADVVSIRTRWEDPNAAFLGFKAGDNKANHSHLDLGTFVFDAQGVRWAVDLGADDYNLPGYFGGNRWKYYRLRAEGHNTLLINPASGPDQDPSAKATLTRFESNRDRSFAIADLTPAYSKTGSKVLRGMALFNNEELLIQDEIQTKGPAEVWWFMHTPAEMQLSDKTSECTLRVGTQALTARILSPAQARFTVLEAKPLPSSPNPNGQRRNNVRKLAVHLENVRDTRLVVLLAPGSGARQRPAPKIVSLSDW